MSRKLIFRLALLKRDSISEGDKMAKAFIKGADISFWDEIVSEGLTRK